MSRNPEFRDYEDQNEDLENFLPPAPTEKEIEEASKQLETLLQIPHTQWQKEHINKFVDFLTNFPILFQIHSKECSKIFKDRVRKELHTINPFDLQSWDSTFYSLLNSHEEFLYSLLYTQSETINFGDEMEEILNQKAKEIFQNAKNIPIPEMLEALYSLKINFNFDLDVKKELEDIIRQLIEQNDLSTIQELIYTYNIYLDEDFGKKEKFSSTDFLEERLALAHQFIEMEKEIPQDKDGLLESSFEKSPVVEKMKWVLRMYADQEAETKKSEDHIYEILELPRDASPEMIGEQIFLKHTKTSPQGQVNVKVQEAYFLISFSNTEDYKKFLSITGERKSGGEYHRAFPLSLGQSIFINTIFINSKEGGPSYEKIVTHERQHFINKLVNLKFLESEYGINKWGVEKYGLKKTLQKRKEKQKELRKFHEEGFNASLQGLKDEWLAFLRDGTRPQEISKILRENPLYSGWYEGLTPEQNDKAKKLLQYIADKIEKTKIFLKISREIFVYMIIDVPLTAWPKYIETLGKYPKESSEDINSYWEQTPLEPARTPNQTKEKKYREFLEEEFEEGRFGKNNKKRNG